MSSQGSLSKTDALAASVSLGGCGAQTVGGVSWTASGHDRHISQHDRHIAHSAGTLAGRVRSWSGPTDRSPTLDGDRTRAPASDR